MLFELPEWFRRMFSPPRCAPYLDAAKGDEELAWNLYRWNIEVSEAFYGPLHCLEVSLRNAIHDQLSVMYAQSEWWTKAQLTTRDASKVAKAKDDLRRKGVNSPTPDDIVAELSFGFWVSLLNRAYDRYLWVPALHKAFPYYGGRRSTVCDNFQAMLLFRNRIMHHEPVHHRSLADDHAKIYRLLGYLEPEVADWLRGIDRVPHILARRPEGGR